MSSTRSLKQYHIKELAKHATASDCWVTYHGKVYNVTPFLDGHPGGEDFILEYAGKDVKVAMASIAGGHDHSKAAYDMLEEYCIGRLATEDSLIDPNWIATDDWHPTESLPEDDYRKSEFLDLTRPLVWQVLTANWSKEFYLEQVHQPRHLARSANLLGPPYLEFLSLTPWYVVPLFWGPIAAYIAYLSIQSFSGGPNHAITSAALASWFSLYLVGCFIWTLLEYGFHRFLFHVDDYLPESNYAFALHFLMHGVHHYLPMDKMRLVMPPTMFAALQYPMTQLAYALFPTPAANAIISGAFTFYILYDCTHYALHHTKLPQYLKDIKAYHLAHHYRNFELGFGVTSRLWDVVFGTELKGFNGKVTTQ